MIGRAFRKIAEVYVLFLLFGLWSGLCLLVGAAWFALVFIADLKARGVL